MSRKNKRDNSQKITARKKWDAIHDKLDKDLLRLQNEISNINKEVIANGK